MSSYIVNSRNYFLRPFIFSTHNAFMSIFNREPLYYHYHIITLTQPKGQIPDYGAPVVLHDQTPSVEDLCNKLHKQVDGINFFGLRILITHLHSLTCLSMS